MESTSKYELCRTNFESLISWYNSQETKRNEATTRLHLIDDIIYKCLGWEKEYVTAEDAYEKEYSDYTFKSISFRNIAILEAKKEGISFELALGTENLMYSLKTLCKDNLEFKKAIVQVSQYCQTRGIQIAIVSNGWQFVGFIANRNDGIAPLEGKACVFSSLENALTHYKEFWNFFSSNGINDYYIYKVLMGESIPKIPAKLSTLIPKYPKIQDRNAFQLDLKILSELVLEDVIRDENVEKIFLQECYCQSGTISQYSFLSKEILSTRYKFMFEEGDAKLILEDAVNRKGLSLDLMDIFSSSLSRRPILLVGDVGAGKSSFIRNLIKVEAETVFEKAICFLINLGSEIVITNNIKDSIIEQIYKKLEKDYQIDIEEDSFVRGTYYSDLQKLRTKSIYKSYFENVHPKALELEIDLLEKKISNKATHLKDSLKHLSKARKQQIIIFIDNCDQREYEDQQSAFLASQEMAEHWDVTVFVTLRPETFHKSLKNGALSGYHPKAFTISPPRIDEVLKKRLIFAKKFTSGELKLSKLNNFTTFTNLENLINIFLDSMESNRELLEFLDNISMGNTRTAIDLVKNFFGSGHIDTQKILNIYHNEGSYCIPIHEFFRAIIYGDNMYFSPKSSPIPNIFDAFFASENEHFILPIFLSVLLHNSSKSQYSGYVELENIITHLQSIGYTIPQINKAIVIAHEKKLIETSERGAELKTEIAPSMLRITSLGAYLSQNIINYFAYIDAIVVDTPIFHDATRKKIHNVDDIKYRVRRSEYFCDYLSTVWSKIKEKEKYFNWERSVDKIKKRTEDIKIRI